MSQIVYEIQSLIAIVSQNPY